MINIPTITELDTPQKRGSLCLKKQYPEFYEMIVDKYKEYPIGKTSEMLYLYFNNMEEPHRCPVCGKYTMFLGWNRGYQEYCGLKCSNNSPEVKKKKEETNISKFGVSSAAKNQGVKAKLVKTYIERHGGMGNASQEVKEKQQQTMIETYGYKHAMQCPAIFKKSQDTLESHYGVRNVFNSEEIRDRARETMKNRYGVEYTLQSETLKEKVKQTNLRLYGAEYGTRSEEILNKIHHTCQEKYGTETPFQSNIIQDKVKKTMIEKYGVDNPLKSKEIQDKIKDTCLERYGVDNPSKNEGIIDRIIDARRQKFLNKTDNVIGYTEEGLWKCRCPREGCDRCSEKTYVISPTQYNNRLINKTEPCTHLLPIQDIHTEGTTIELKIRDILDRHNISYIKNDREILGGKEVDIYIPSHQLAIECNGIYWHSSRKKSFQYHYDKYEGCLAKGIQLLTFWEDQLLNSPEIVENIILSKLGIYEKKIGGRQCEIREVNPSDSAKFLIMNHLQGSVHGQVYLGLYYKDELVSLMTFGKKRGALGNKQTRDGEWELYRFCNKMGVKVSGAASKLLHYFIEYYSPQVIESFSANDISTGDLYRKLGFEKLYNRPGSYWYIDENMKRYHRFTFTKGRLVKEGADPSLSEAEIMMSLGYTRIYDSGQTKWILKIS